jgi:hypothetical protein
MTGMDVHTIEMDDADWPGNLLRAFATSLQASLPEHVAKVAFIESSANILNAWAERVSEKHYHITITRALITEARLFSHKLMKGPAFGWIAEGRMDFAEQLFHRIIEIVLLHEGGHVIYGHLEAGYEDHLIGAVSVDPYLLSQIREWEADTYAMNCCLRRAFEICEHITDYPPQLRPAYKTPTEVMVMVTSAIHMLMNLIDSAPVDFTAIPTLSHPPTQIRKHIAVANCWEILKSKPEWGYSALLFPQLAAGAAVTVGSMFPECVTDMDTAMKPFSADGEAYIEKMANELERLRPELVKFRLIDKTN